MLLEILLVNFNFVLLSITLILYLVQITLLLPERYHFFAPNATYVSCFFQTSFLCLRWFSSGHFPLSNLYESLLFLSWGLMILLIYFNRAVKKALVSPIPLNIEPLLRCVPGTIITPIAFLLNVFAILILPEELKLSSALVPALQSNWLLMHVTVMVLSYGALLTGCLFAMVYLVILFFIKNNQEKMKPLVGTQLVFSNTLIETVDNLSYRMIGIGFPLLTIGLLSGAVWANQTWGSYWSWDPKETWALITWLIFAIYLHTRISKGWNTRQSATLATFGFVVLWICYLGVNLMGNGLHSYGFLS